MHTALARNQNLQMKYSTNSTGIYSIFHKKHFIIGGTRGKPNQSVVYKTEEEKNAQINYSKYDLNKLWLIVKKVQFANPVEKPASENVNSNSEASGAEGSGNNNVGSNAANNGGANGIMR
jgi:hypothetical protein